MTRFFFWVLLFFFPIQEPTPPPTITCESAVADVTAQIEVLEGVHISCPSSGPKGIWGYYWPSTRLIEVFPQPEHEYHCTVAHELGHSYGVIYLNDRTEEFAISFAKERGYCQ